ncbi:MAG: hypothetical protein P8Q16_01160 [Flavobacteriales bacterium]|jgi:hypothetical protein|nr:hypothetical protein [Flavobacteriales bacterium]MDG1439347.1 hypothetical protein [Flavobacteriales bacterium]MDG1797751.1 hypothetical protein [Flavobacteriales bacterium]
MKALAISDSIEVLLPKMGIMTHLVELTRHDYIYVKDQININEVLSIKADKSRFWEENSLAVFYKEFKLGYLNNTINKVVQKMIIKYGYVKVILKNKPKGSNPFEGIDVLIQIG